MTPAHALYIMTTPSTSGSRARGEAKKRRPRALKCVHHTMLQDCEDAAPLRHAAGVCILCIWKKRREAGPPEHILTGLSHLRCALTQVQGKLLRLYAASG